MAFSGLLAGNSIDCLDTVVRLIHLTRRMFLSSNNSIESTLISLDPEDRCLLSQEQWKCQIFKRLNKQMVVESNQIWRHSSAQTIDVNGDIRWRLKRISTNRDRGKEIDSDRPFKLLPVNAIFSSDGMSAAYCILTIGSPPVGKPFYVRKMENKFSVSGVMEPLYMLNVGNVISMTTLVCSEWGLSTSRIAIFESFEEANISSS